MMAGIAEVLTFAIGVAISPVPIIAVILMLFSSLAKINGPLFLLGWAVIPRTSFWPRAPGQPSPASGWRPETLSSH